jgi:predicted ABC-type ATPase
MPILHILAGPNGSGKTTFFETAVSEKFIDPALPFINVDLITRNLSGGYTAENFARADEMARQEISRYINLREDFMIESNLATQRDYDWIDGVKKKGYEIVLYFLCTENIEINFGRVQKRVAEGGHSVAVSIIEHRYKMGLTYLKGKLHLFKKVYLIDTSSETALVMAELSDGIIQRKEASSPKWVHDLLYIVERMSKK